MISLTSDTETVDVKESLLSDRGIIKPRISRTATLDGGSVITSSGCSHSDRTIEIVASGISSAQEAILRRMTMQAVLVQLANTEGVFTGAISRLSCKNGELKLTFLVKEKLTED